MTMPKHITLMPDLKRVAIENGINGEHIASAPVDSRWLIGDAVMRLLNTLDWRPLTVRLGAGIFATKAVEVEVARNEPYYIVIPAAMFIREGQKIPVIVALRNLISNVGLKDAKELVEDHEMLLIGPVTGTVAKALTNVIAVEQGVEFYLMDSDLPSTFDTQKYRVISLMGV